MDDEDILDIYNQTVNAKEKIINPFDQAFQDMKTQGDVGNLFQKNKRRRSKKDKTGRNFFCGCGKDYLSYPALYTHIKNKHDGIPPEGTTKQHQTRVRPGRPSKSKMFNCAPRMAKEEDSKSQTVTGFGNDMDSSVNDNTSIGKSANDMDPFSPMKMNKTIEGFRKRRKLNLDNFAIVKDLECEGLTSPTHSFEKTRNPLTNQFILHPIAELISKLRYNQEGDEFYEVLTCDKIFSIFLTKLSTQSNKTFYGYVSMLLRALRECINQFGYDLLDVYGRQNPK